jgi:hypothetical protein
MMMNLANPTRFGVRIGSHIEYNRIVPPRALPQLVENAVSAQVTVVSFTLFCCCSDKQQSRKTYFMYSSARRYLSSCSICCFRPKFLAAESRYEVTILNAILPFVRWSSVENRLART